MIIPPYKLIMETLQSGTQNSGDAVAVPIGFLRHILSLCILASNFDEHAYSKRNPDIVVALRKGETKDIKKHYADYGYFEGRAGIVPEVDEAWYLKTNPDVASAVKSGIWKSGQHHWEIAGMLEWRSPNRSVQDAWAMWHSLLTDSKEGITKAGP